MTQKELNEAITIAVRTYGRDAAIEALHKMYHDGLVPMEMLIPALDALNA